MSRYPASSHLYLFSRHVLGAAEHVTLGASLAAELMHLDHLTEGDEADESVRWQQTEGHLERLLRNKRTTIYKVKKVA